jgi:hypothetical protein
MAIRVTQLGLEVWVHNSSRIRVTQIGLEVWRRVTDAPAATTGLADGIARVWGFTPNAVLTTGQADGYATAQDDKAARGSAIMVVMGI